MHSQRVVDDGFVSERQYGPSTGDQERIYFTVTGHFVMLKDQPESIQLLDEHTRILHPLENVALLHSVSSQLEGKKKFPRPFIYEKSADDSEESPIGSKLVSAGETVLISYVGGSIRSPLVVGAIESLSVINQHKFLRLDGQNLDRQSERYENSRYFFEFENDGKGRLSTKIVAKEPEGEEEGGTGNIEFELEGTKGHGKVTATINGIFKFIQNLARPKLKPVQIVTLDNTDEAEFVEIIQQSPDGELRQRVLLNNKKDDPKIIVMDKTGNTVTMDKEGIKIDVVGRADVNVTGEATIDAEIIKLNGAAGNVLTNTEESATPFCKFSGKPFPGVPTVKSGAQ